MAPALRRRLVLMGLLCIVMAAGCGDAEPAQPRASASAGGSSSPKSGIQPNEALKPGAGDRVPATLIGPKLHVEGLSLVRLDSEWMDDVVTDACGNRSGNGVYQSRLGQRREWQAPGLEVQQFAGAFGAVTAAEAVAQGRATLTCDIYEDREGTHRLLGEVAAPVGPPVDGYLTFCEVDNEGTTETRYSCTAVLARQDIATRIQVKARSESQVRQVVQQLQSLAAQVLGKAW